MKEKNLDDLLKLFKTPVKTINREDGSTIVEFESGEKVSLGGIPMETEQDIPVCSFCGEPSVNEFLFTTNDSAFICRHCVLLSIKTFLQNGIDVDIPLTEALVNQIRKV